ncbi:MAG: nucleoside-triphosphatase [Elusimicrobiales bacterium]
MKTENGGKSGVVWRKAAVLGGIWAASEIVLGSFLHNVRLPFSGELLTAVGIAVLVAGHRLWPERGLLWRTGLICAAMKSVSPSAVIFGPMVAIFMEGLLAEAGVRLLGGNAAGYLLGGGLAMSWPLAHKAAELLIFYGPGAVELYLRGVGWLRAYSGFGPGNSWTPLLLMFAVYFLCGAAAAAAGMRAGKEKAPLTERSARRPPAGQRGSGAAPLGAYSVTALMIHLLFVSAVMAAGRRIPLPALSAAAGIYGTLCARFYPRAGSLLKRAGIWAGVLAASLLAGALLGSAEAGLYMALRAFTLTLAFAAIGSELVNPAIRARLEPLGGAVFFETLQYAFNALPAILAGLPSGREFAGRPLAVLGGTVARAPFLLDAILRPPVFIITGAHGAGKSGLVLELALALRAAGKKPGGICAAGLWTDGLRTGFDLIDLASDARVPLCRRGLAGAAATAGEFGFYPEGLAAGASALSPEKLSEADAVFVDEIGFLELAGGGWAAPLERCLKDLRRPLVLVSRDYLLDKVRARWGLDNAVIWRAGRISAGTAVKDLENAVNKMFCSSL